MRARQSTPQIDPNHNSKPKPHNKSGAPHVPCHHIKQHHESSQAVKQNHTPHLILLLAVSILLTACGPIASAVPRATEAAPAATLGPEPTPWPTLAQPYPPPMPAPEVPVKVACIGSDGVTRYYVHPRPSLLGPPPWPELPCAPDVTPQPTEQPPPTPLPPRYPARVVLDWVMR